VGVCDTPQIDILIDARDGDLRPVGVKRGLVDRPRRPPSLGVTAAVAGMRASW
jgi:hypothetical protein